jgi:hypothetical protein
VRDCAGALPWLHDPYDGEQEQMRLLFQMPVFAHLEREAIAFGIMATVAVALVYVPVCVCTLIPGLLPLRFHLLDVTRVIYPHHLNKTASHMCPEPCLFFCCFLLCFVL